jgi:hypothetical protein
MALGKRNVSDVLAGGDLRASLERLRDRLAAELDIAGPCFECDRSDPRLVATLVKELSAVLVRIDELPVAEGASRVDELASARKARQGKGRRDSADVAQRPAVSD